jgi:hypothetical protein
MQDKRREWNCLNTYLRNYLLSLCNISISQKQFLLTLPKLFTFNQTTLIIIGLLHTAVMLSIYSVYDTNPFGRLLEVTALIKVIASGRHKNET